MRSTPYSILAATAAVLGMALVSGQAQAANMIITDKSAHERPVTIDPFVELNFWWGGGVGAGVWVDIPIVPEGLIKPLNDSFEIDVGAVVNTWSDSALSVSPRGGVRWSFYLTPEWTVYGVSRLGYRVVLSDTNMSIVELESGVGAYYQMEALRLRLESTNYGMRAGLSFSF